MMGWHVRVVCGKMCTLVWQYTTLQSMYYSVHSGGQKLVRCSPLMLKSCIMLECGYSHGVSGATCVGYGRLEISINIYTSMQKL